MSVSIYRDTNYQGPFARIRPGFYSGQDLRGFRNQSAYGAGEDLDNAISSIRVGPNTIVALYGGQSPSASAGSRVLVGPYDVPDLGALGMGDKTSAIQVLPYKGYDSGIPRTGGAVLYNGYEGLGKSSVLEQGDYNAARLASEEVKFPNNRLRSLRVSANVIAILYDGPDFDTSMDAVVVVGPTMVGDLDRIGLLDRVSSVRVMYTDPFDTPARPTANLGTSRAYFPGGDAGYAGPPPQPRRSFEPPGPRQQEPQPPELAAYGSPGGTPAGSKERRRMWTVIIVLFVLVLVLGARVAAATRAVRAAKKVGGAAMALGFRDTPQPKGFNLRPRGV
jgi:hypothetical protein